MTDEIKQYLKNISKEDLLREWNNEQKETDLFTSWIGYLDEIEKGETSKEQFAYEISSDAFRYIRDCIKNGDTEPELENIKNEVKKSLSHKENKTLLKEYGFKSNNDIDWEFYRM